MQFRKLNVLFLIGVSLLSGCSSTPKKALLSNSQFLLYGDCDDKLLFHTPSLEEFTNLYNSNLSYIILFSQEGCSACQNFDPIIKQYIEETHQFVLLVDGEDKYKIQDEYKDKFFPESNILTPSIFVKENGDNIYNVNYSKYMNTYPAFKNHMDSRYKTSKCAYFSVEIPGKTPIISNYTYVSFQANETFKNKISPKILDTENNVLISTNFEKNFMTVFEKNLSGDFEIARTTPITDDLDDETIAKYI